jgi:hypothetical protein
VTSAPAGCGSSSPSVNWLVIDLPYACFVIEIDDHGIVTKAAPIGGWMVGKRITDVLRWAAGKGAAVW